MTVEFFRAVRESDKKVRNPSHNLTPTMTAPATTMTTPGNTSSLNENMEAYIATASNSQLILLICIAAIMGLGKGGAKKRAGHLWGQVAGDSPYGEGRRT